MIIGQEYTAKIEKLSNNGDGIARIDGCVVFVKNSCPGDEVKIVITHITSSYAVAEITEFVSRSAYRVAPFCSMQKICGACQLQFIEYNYQLELKSKILEDALHSIAGVDVAVPITIASPDCKCYRYKIQYPICQTKNSKRILAGYYKQKSHEIVNIKHCPIQPEICDLIMDYIRESSKIHKISGYNEKLHLGDLRHVVLRVSSFNKMVLVTLVINGTKISKNMSEFAKAIYDKFSEVVGVCINLNTKKTNVILSQNTKLIAGQNYIEEKILDKTFLIGSDTFFQVNPRSAENIFNYVKEKISSFSSAPSVLDAYAGIAVFGVLVSDVAKEVVCVESNKNSIQIASKVLNLNNIKNIELNANDTTKYLMSVRRKFDISIIDPPRKGCSKESLDEIVKHTKN